MLERAIKDLIEEFRSQELNLSEQKKNTSGLQIYFRKTRFGNFSTSRFKHWRYKYYTAIQMANQGKSLDEISSATGLSNEEIEPILKYHGKP